MGLVIIFSLSLFVGKSSVSAEWYIDNKGNLVYTSPAGEVLGVVYAKDGEGGGGSSGSSGSGSSGSGSGGGGGEEKKEEKKEESKSGFSTGGTSGSVISKPKINQIIPSAKPSFKIEDENDEEMEDDEDEAKTFLMPLSNDSATGGPKIKQEKDKIEYIFGEGEKIKIRTKDGEVRTDVYSGGVKVRFEQKDGRMIIKAENENDQEIILGEQELFKIEERLDKNTIKVATGSGNSFVFARGGIGAQTQFPLSVDLATNALTVQTPTGPKVVTILPDAAVQNMLAANVISRLSTETIVGATGSAALSGVGDIVQLGLRSGVPVYEISGLSNQKLLGFIPVVIPAKVIVSAETGALVVKETSPLNTLLDLVSF